MSAKTIRLCTQSEWDHVGMVVRLNIPALNITENDLLILEATNEGCLLANFKQKVPSMGNFFK
jgi:hypothetical protein